MCGPTCGVPPGPMCGPTCGVPPGPMCGPIPCGMLMRGEPPWLDPPWLDPPGLDPLELGGFVFEPVRRSTSACILVEYVRAFLLRSNSAFCLAFSIFCADTALRSSFLRSCSAFRASDRRRRLFSAEFDWRWITEFLMLFLARWALETASCRAWMAADCASCRAWMDADAASCCICCCVCRADDCVSIAAWTRALCCSITCCCAL